MPHVQASITDRYSSTAYTKLLRAFLSERTNTTIIVKNQHATHHLKFKILVSNDLHGAANTWAEEKAEATINGGTAPVRYVLTGPFLWVEIQIASAGTDESPQASAWVVAVGL